MRLMCSQDPAEVELVKNELSKAGIAAEAVRNPVAESLGISGIELWVQDERDFFDASRLFADLQNRTSGTRRGAAAEPQSQAPDACVAPEKPEAGETERPQEPNQEVKGRDSKQTNEPPREELDQVSSSLEKEINEMLERESGLVAECESLRSRTEEMRRALAEARAAFARETKSRAAAEREGAERLSGLRSAWECERTERARAEAQLERERHEWQRLLKSRDDSLKETQQQLDSQSQLLQTQQAAMVELREQIMALEQQRDTDEASLAAAREEAVREREARFAAEERAVVAAEAQKSLEQQLLEQKDLSQRMQAHVASINSLCTKLQARKVASV